MTTQTAIKTQQYRDKIQTNKTDIKTDKIQTHIKTDKLQTNKTYIKIARGDRRTNSHGPVASHGLTDVVGGGDVGHRLVVLPVLVHECADILTMVLLLLTKGRKQDTDETRLDD